MQDLKQLAKIVSVRKGISLEEATAIVKQLTEGKTLFAAKLAINNFLETKVGQTTLKGYHETEPIDRIKE